MIAPISALNILKLAIDGIDARATILLVLLAAVFAAFLGVGTGLAAEASGTLSSLPEISYILVLLMIGTQIAAAAHPDMRKGGFPLIVWTPRHSRIFLMFLGILLMVALTRELAIGIVAGLEGEWAQFQAQRTLLQLAEEGAPLSRSDSNLALLTIIFMPLFLIMSFMALIVVGAVPLFAAVRLLPTGMAKLAGRDINFADGWRYTTGNTIQLMIIIAVSVALMITAALAGDLLGGIVRHELALSVPWTAQFLEMIAQIAPLMFATMLSMTLVTTADDMLFAAREQARKESRFRRNPARLTGEAVGLV